MSFIFGVYKLKFFTESVTSNDIAIYKIPLLLSIGEEDNALTKATESGDTDLVYLVLFHIWRKVCSEF